MTVYDSCIYPQEQASAASSYLTYCKDILTRKTTLKKPELLHSEQEFCISTHLIETCDRIKGCSFSSEGDFNHVYQQIIMVHDSFDNAKKVNTNVKLISKEVTIFDGSCTKVLMQKNYFFKIDYVYLADFC